MEQSDSIGRVTRYQLATLAARIWPRVCVESPARAIAVAERLLEQAEVSIERAYQEQRNEEWKQEEAQMPRKRWVAGLKEITGQKRRDRAEKRFAQFMEHQLPGKSKQQLNSFKREGFSQYEIAFLQHHFRNWVKEPKRKKGKQGRRISDADRRLRIGSFRLSSKKTAKRV